MLTKEQLIDLWYKFCESPKAVKTCQELYVKYTKLCRLTINNITLELEYCTFQSTDKGQMYCGGIHSIKKDYVQLTQQELCSMYDKWCSINEKSEKTYEEILAMA